MKLVDLAQVTLTGLFICTLNMRGEQGSNNVEQRVNNILAQMTLDEKLSYIGGTYTPMTYGVFNIRGIPRLGLPEIDMCNGPLGIQSLIGQDSTRYPAGLALALISAMQEQQVWADVKHYACNEQEYRRESINIEVGERPLREIYLPPSKRRSNRGTPLR
jgi:beta-glucosidase-like glycosyl hydrolase